MGDRDRPTRGRAQAFTLEGLIGAVVLLTAVLFALQAINAVPTEDEGVSPSAETELSGRAHDVLAMAAQNHTFGLSDLVRYYSPAQGRFYGASGTGVGYGDGPPPGSVGRLLESAVTQQGGTYNLRLRYRNGSLAEGWERTTVVDQGVPPEDAVVATYTITLYDNQTLTSPNTAGVELQEVSPRPGGESYYPIPDAVDGPVYNVVEVRLTVW